MESLPRARQMVANGSVLGWAFYLAILAMGFTFAISSIALLVVLVAKALAM